MAQLDTQILPLLPLTTGVVLPGMVITLTVESDDARRAVTAADATRGEILLVPKVGQRFAQVGTVAKVEDVGRLQNGMEALVIRGLHRAVIGRGVPGTGDAVWVEVDPRPDEVASPRARELAREYRAALESIVEARGVPQVAEFLRGISDPGQIADTAGYSPDLSFEQKVDVLEMLDVERRLETVLEWAKDVLAELELKDKIRSDVDWMTEIPWGVRTEDNLDIADARRILDEDHQGLDDVKDRIVEYLAVRKLREERGLGPASGRGSGAILTLVGPPGVGKTSLGESVARALGRKFVRISLGGIHDEAEIRGHRRTYVGALPGRIVRALKEAGTKNPVMMLDEVDKVGADWRGDPSSALLEVLDPAQNHTFRDHYLEVDLDLSEVLFISTANVAETIPGPLLDRMEVIRLDGYTEDEKVAIARYHLLGRQLERNGLNADEIAVTDGAIRQVVGDYTREAGVRNLERELGKVLRKVATKLARGDAHAPVNVDVIDIREYLGRPRFFFEAAERTSVPGVATGLAVTGTGGDVLFIEATRMEGEGPDALMLTGQLGDVMKESGQIALSYVRSHAEELGVPASSFGGRFHVHVPAGAVPKDGTSARVAMGA